MSRFHGLVLPSLLLVVASPFAVAIATGGGEPTGGTSEPPPPPAITELGGMLSCAGLSAEALTASGVASSEVDDLVADGYDFISGSGQTLAELDSSFVAAKQAEEALRRRVKRGTAPQAVVTQLASAKVATGQASSTRDTFLDGIFEAATATLAAGEVTALTNLRGNRSWHIDTAYCVVNRTEPEWVALSDALGAQHVALEEGTAVPPLSQALLAEEDADPAIAAAKTNLSTYLGDVQTAWNTAVSAPR